jgi:hypothetical protein
MTREELKVNIIIKGDRIFLGVQATDCDPKMTTLQGNLQTALDHIPTFVEEANRQWDASPRNPRSTIPEPVTTASVRTATTTAGMVTKPTPAKPAQPAQPNFF